MKKSSSKSRCGRNQDRKLEDAGIELISCDTERLHGSVEGRCSLEEMKSAFLEADGRFSVLTESDRRFLSRSVRGG